MKRATTRQNGGAKLSVGQPLAIGASQALSSSRSADVPPKAAKATRAAVAGAVIGSAALRQEAGGPARESGASSAGATDAAALAAEMKWLSAVIDQRIRAFFGSGDGRVSWPPAPAVRGDSPYGALLARFAPGDRERLLLALALAPHLAPHVLDGFLLKNENTGRNFTEVGGIKGEAHAGFLPTGQTALFLLGGDDFAARMEVMRLLDPRHTLSAAGPLRLASPVPGEPAWSGPLEFSPSWLRHLLYGEKPGPDLEPMFPAAAVTTALAPDDLVLAPATAAGMAEIRNWARHGPELRRDWGLERHSRPGFCALFHGPPGTGKTLAAALLGRELAVDVYRLDLAAVVSRYVTETEANLRRLFDEAERRDWILLLDEADALFGRRTEVRDAHDRYANVAVAYLLQRVDDYRGIVVVTAQDAANLDDALFRRMDVVVPFPRPDATQRECLWKNVADRRVQLADDVSWSKIAREHELTGGQIAGAFRRACLRAATRDDRRLTREDIVAGIRSERERARPVRSRR
ncbi:MAG TPA: ATP-binding protein [Opitutus sp.]|nr:ATP-binding protein [Opitutus sp.]